MKNIMIILLLVIGLHGCTIEQHLKIKTNLEAKRTYHKADTIYVYSVTFNDWTLLWYHKNGCIYKRYIYPNKIKRGKAPKYVSESEVLVFAQKCNQKNGTIAMEKAKSIAEGTELLKEELKYIDETLEKLKDRKQYWERLQIKYCDE